MSCPLIKWLCSKETPETHQDKVPGQPALGNPAEADVGPEDLHRSLTLHTWVGYSALVCLLKHLNSDQLPVRKDAGTRNDPKLNPPKGFILKQQLPIPENLVATVRRELRPFYRGHQQGGPRSHSTSADEHESATGATESQNSEQTRTAEGGRILFSLGEQPLSRKGHW